VAPLAMDASVLTCVLCSNNSTSDRGTHAGQAVSTSVSKTRLYLDGGTAQGDTLLHNRAGCTPHALPERGAVKVPVAIVNYCPQRPDVVLAQVVLDAGSLELVDLRQHGLPSIQHLRDKAKL
jgi:hypothetical protein